MASTRFNLAVRVKPVPDSTGRATDRSARSKNLNKVSEPGPKTPKRLVEYPGAGDTVMALFVHTPPLISSRAQSEASSGTNQEMEALVASLASTRLENKHVYDTRKVKSNKQVEPQVSSARSHIVSDAFTAWFERVHIEEACLQERTPIHVRFHCQEQLLPIADPLVIDLDEAPDLFALTNLILNRGRLFFRESDLTKKSPVEYRFTITYRHVEDCCINDDTRRATLWLESGTLRLAPA